MGTTIGRESITATHAVIERCLRATPIVEMTGSDFGLCSFPLALKLEHWQHSSSFKRPAGPSTPKPEASPRTPWRRVGWVS